MGRSPLRVFSERASRANRCLAPCGPEKNEEKVSVFIFQSFFIAAKGGPPIMSRIVELKSTRTVEKTQAAYERFKLVSVEGRGVGRAGDDSSEGSGLTRPERQTQKLMVAAIKTLLLHIQQDSLVERAFRGLMDGAFGQGARGSNPHRAPSSP
jgi:hypothetical protein